MPPSRCPPSAKRTEQRVKGLRLKCKARHRQRWRVFLFGAQGFLLSISFLSQGYPLSSQGVGGFKSHVFPTYSLSYSLPIPGYYDSYSYRFPRRCSPRPSVFPLSESTNTYERPLGHWSSLHGLIPQAVSSAILVRLSIRDRTQHQSLFTLVPLAGQVASLPILILLLWPEKYQSTSAPLDKTLDKGWGIQAFASSKG